MKKIITIAAMLLCSQIALLAGNLAFSKMLGDNMVLQQNAPVTLWGTATPRADVAVTGSWNGVTVKVKADKDGHWEAVVNTPAGSFDAQTVKVVSGSETIEAKNVLIGEVWYCSGQSNMEMTLGGGFGTFVEGSLEEIALSAQYTGVRHITIKKATPLEPAWDAEGEWQVCNPVNSPKFSAVAYFFATRLSKALNVPVGVINASWGGCFICPWMSKETLKDYPVNLADATDDSVNNMFKPFVMYNGMFKPVSKFAINGFIWYQGESNVSTRCDIYADMMNTMVKTWRKDVGRGDIPFLIVELAPYDYHDGEYGLQDETGPLLREQQALAAKTIPNAAIIGTNDLAYDFELTQVHPSQKRQIGERACFMAMNMAYGYTQLPAFHPTVKYATAEGRTVKVYFDNASTGFRGSEFIEGFEIAGESGNYHKATTARTSFSFRGGACVELECKEVGEPAFVRYCFHDFQIGNLKGANGLPAIPFQVKITPASEIPAAPMPQRQRTGNYN